MVWWIRQRLIAERERACDEAVAASATDPQVYAEAILKVCRFYLALAPGCASGVTGANLKERIVEIMAERTILDLTRGKRVLLVGTLLAAMVLPVAVGILGAQTQRPEAFDVASVKLNSTREKGTYPGLAPGGQRYAATNLPLMALIMLAYDVSPAQISGMPEALTREGYDVEGKCDRPMTKEQTKRMLQTLLADRFKLVIRREAREQPIYELVVAKNGPKLRENTEEGLPTMRRNGPGESRSFQRTPMSALTLILSQQVDRPVVDKTGLTGRYDFNLSYWLDRPGNMRGPGDGGPPAPASESLAVGVHGIAGAGGAKARAAKRARRVYRRGSRRKTDGQLA